MSIEWQCDREGVPRLRNSCMAKSKRSNRDHAHQHQYPGLDNEVIAADLQALLTPALFAQQAYFRQLGMRERILNLSLMLAAVLTLLWRQVPSVQELTRMLAREDLLWCKAVQVSQQAVSQRFLGFPSVKFIATVYGTAAPTPTTVAAARQTTSGN